MTDHIIYVRKSVPEEPCNGCANRAVRAQDSWAEQVLAVTGYNKPGHRSSKQLRAALERDRRAVYVLRHIGHLFGNGRFVRMTTVPSDVMDLLSRGLAFYCKEHDHFTVTMAGHGMVLVWSVADVHLRHAEQLKRLRRMAKNPAARRGDRPRRS